MNKIRIGNTLVVLVSVARRIDGHESPYDLRGRDMSCVLQKPNGERVDIDYVVEGEEYNVIRFVFEGRDQQLLGGWSRHEMPLVVD